MAAGPVANNRGRGDTWWMLELKGTACPKCGQEVPVWSMARCPVCGREVCHTCAYLVYGRQFCSADCGVYFMSGDEDADLEEEEQKDKAEG